MIVFHEGLPGSGKSYEAMAERIVPAIAKGRAVVAYVEGIDFAKVAELAGCTEERCRELLTALTREQMAEWLTHCKDNALHVFDEAQNFWGNRTKLSDAQTQLVTEHRHRGMDIVLMGQDLRDVHATWRRRVELKLCFLKLNGLGFANRYSVTTYRHLGGDQFSKAGVTLRKYDPRFFGSYASHVSDDTNAEVYTDKRAQLWNRWGFKVGGPLALVAVLWGVNSAWTFFHPEPAQKPVAAAASPGQAQAVPMAQNGPQQGIQPTPAPIAAKPDPRSSIERRMADMSSKYRIRLAGFIDAGERFDGYVEWVDTGARVMDRLSLQTLRQMGVAVVKSDSFLRLAVGGWEEVATMWPTEAEGRVSAARLEGTRPHTGPAGGGLDGAQIVGINGERRIMPGQEGQR